MVANFNKAVLRLLISCVGALRDRSDRSVEQVTKFRIAVDEAIKLRRGK